MKRIFTALIVVLSIGLIATSCGNRKKAEQNNTDMAETTVYEPEFNIVTNFGTMKIKLYDKTPKHRENFTKLVSEKYYDGIRFHRVIEGFMIQTGDPYSRDLAMANAWGTGGPEYTIPAEFVSQYYHKKGALAAARKGDMANPKKASSGSQFYIVHDENNCLHLDGQYTIFGEVVEGLEIIDKIAAVETDPYDRPLQDVIIESIRPVAADTVQVDTTAVKDTAAKDSIEAKPAILPETMLINE
ncbi:MAG: peptidylprolyl isomerase [Bacteroidales bacterium]|nr:peptidylprolyl isomerase [Bacteroidales bacterium]